MFAAESGESGSERAGLYAWTAKYCESRIKKMKNTIKAQMQFLATACVPLSYVEKELGDQSISVDPYRDETDEILLDKEAMRLLAEAEDDKRKGRATSGFELRKNQKNSLEFH